MIAERMVKKVHKIRIGKIEIGDTEEVLYAKKGGVDLGWEGTYHGGTAENA
jgi:hypothetical protein